MSDLQVLRITKSPEETQELGATLGSLLLLGDVLLLTGDLGAGKTQFAKGIAVALGIKRPITGPTFNLIFEYPAGDGGPVVLRHFDLYRLENQEELQDIDYFGLLEDTVVSIVEWGDKFPQALPLDFLLIDFEFVDENKRTLRLKAFGQRSQELLKTITEVFRGR